MHTVGKETDAVSDVKNLPSVQFLLLPMESEGVAYLGLGPHATRLVCTADLSTIAPAWTAEFALAFGLYSGGNSILFRVHLSSPHFSPPNPQDLLLYRSISHNSLAFSDLQLVRGNLDPEYHPVLLVHQSDAC